MQKEPMGGAPVDQPDEVSQVETLATATIKKLYRHRARRLWGALGVYVLAVVATTGSIAWAYNGEWQVAWFVLLGSGMLNELGDRLSR